MTDHSVETQSEKGDALLAQADRLVARLSDARDAIGALSSGRKRSSSICSRPSFQATCAFAWRAGLGKTLLVSTAAHVLGLDTKRIQFTPDLMPSDITGSEILEETKAGQRGFRFIPGQSLPRCSLPTKSTAPAPARNPRCFRRCRNIG